MKVQILKSFTPPHGHALIYGDVLSPPDDIALTWIKHGFARPYGQQVETTSMAPAAETTSALSRDNPRAQPIAKNRSSR